MPSERISVQLKDSYNIEVDGGDRVRGPRVDVTGQHSRIFPPDDDLAQSQQLTTEMEKVARNNDGEIRHDSERLDDSDIRFLEGITPATIIDTITILFGTGGAAYAFIETVRPIVIQWMKNRSSRSVTVKKGNLEIKIEGSGDLDKAVKALKVIEDKGE